MWNSAQNESDIRIKKPDSLKPGSYEGIVRVVESRRYEEKG